jgi:hypothetical protein
MAHDWKFIEELFAINEGAEDSKYRKTAMDVADKIESALKSGKLASVKTFPGSFMLQGSKPVILVAIRLSDLIDNPAPEHKNIAVRFLAAKTEDNHRASATYKLSGKGLSMIDLFFKFKNAPFTGDKTKDENQMVIWTKHVVKHGAEMFAKKKNAFEHEYIHYLDSMRLKAPWGKVAGATQSKRQAGGLSSAEAGDPLELNAYSQQSMARIKRELDKGKEAKKSLLGGSAQEFIKNITRKKLILPGFFDLLDEVGKRKFLKRLAQMWQEESISDK